MTLCFLLRTGPDGQAQVLLGRKLRGFGTGKIVGLGGHIEPGEDARTAAARETVEESGLVVDPSVLEQRGNLAFRFPAEPRWNMEVAVFTSEVWHGELSPSDEILPAWFDALAPPFEQMWDDNRHWLPRVLSGERVNAEFTFADDGETVADWHE